ncbi:MAG: ABC transporter substrate-binding protein [Candidatus Pacebacteria bacterium]|nr:ABC transporter substrate-binding protein [Candidatus Paceibacterota bacterium]
MNKNIKTILGLIVAVLAVWGIYSISQKPSEPTEGEVIKIGAILPLTGKIALTGEQIQSGMELAVEDINAKYENKKISILYEDSKLDPKAGVSAVNKLINIEHVKYIHTVATSVILAVQPITEKNSVVMTAASLSPTILKDTSYTLRMMYNLNQATEKLADFINLHQYKKIAVLYQNNDACEDQVSQLENAGISFLKKEKFNIDEKDFRTLLLKIKSTNPEITMMFGYGSIFPIIFKQMNELRMEDMNVLGGLDFLEVPPDTLSLYKNVKFIVPAFNLNQSNKSRNFTERYKQKFGKNPNHQAAYAYDTVNLLYLGITNTDGTPTSVMNYLKNIGNYNGVLGKTVLINGDMKSDLLFAMYKNKQLMPYEK